MWTEFAITSVGSPSTGIRQPQPCWQVRPGNSILRSRVLVLKEEFLVDQPCYIRQQTSPMIAVFHAKFHHRSFLVFKLLSILTIRR
jgi:hypothetical protein